MNDQQRFDQLGKIREAFDKLHNARSSLNFQMKATRLLALDASKRAVRVLLL
jgi:hypothetical protein